MPERRRLLLSFAFLLAAAALSAGATRSPARVSRVYPLGLAGAASTYELVQSLVSPGGRAVLDEGNLRIVVLDMPEVQERVAALMKELQKGGPLVRVAVSFSDLETREAAGIAATGQLIVSPRGAGTAVSARAAASKGRSGRRSNAFVVVVSGGSASIAVGEEIPYLNWFFDYGRERGYLREGIDWKEVRSGFAVTPDAAGHGRPIRLRLVPEFSYPAGKGRERIRFADAATEVIVPDGGEITVAGGGEREEFYSRFLAGYDSHRRVRRVVITVRVNMVPGLDI